MTDEWDINWHYCSSSDPWMPTLYEAIKARDQAAVLKLAEELPYLASFVALHYPLPDVAWFFDNKLGSVDCELDYDNPYREPLVSRFVERTRQPRYRPVFRFLLKAKANLETRMEETQGCPAFTPIDYALELGNHYAVTELIKAGASTTNCGYDEWNDLLRNGWLPCWEHCRYAIAALLAAMKRASLERDMRLLIARRVWKQRYDVRWLREGEGTNRLE